MAFERVQSMKIGLVGFGSMGTLHANQLRHIEDVDISIIVEPGVKNRDNAKTYFASMEVEIFEKLDDALSKNAPDAWIVTSSTNTHIPIAQKLLSKGHKVLLEKPLAESYKTACLLKDFVKKDNSNFMLGHILLWNKEFQFLRSEVKKLGEITSIKCSRERFAGTRLLYPGESPFSLLMVHDLYTVHSLMSGIQPAKFSAQVRKHPKGGVDLAQGQLSWTNGAFASLLANFLIPDEIEGGGNIDELTVSGSGWRVQLIYDSGFITLTTAAGVRVLPVPPPLRDGARNYFDDALRSEQEDFFDLIRGKSSVMNGASYDDACQIQEWISRFIALTEENGAK
jgi:predicted dehydrogenase